MEDRYKSGRSNRPDSKEYGSGRKKELMPAFSRYISELKKKEIQKELDRLYQQPDFSESKLKEFAKAHQKDLALIEDKKAFRILSITEGKATARARGHGMTSSADGDMEDGNRECLLVSGNLSYAERQKLRSMTREMRDLDREIDLAQEMNDTVRVKGALAAWENVKADMVFYLKSKKVQVKAIPKKDEVKEIRKIREIYQEKTRAKEHTADTREAFQKKEQKKKENTRVLTRTMEES